MPSKLDKIIYNLQFAIIGGVVVSWLIDPSFGFFGLMITVLVDVLICAYLAWQYFITRRVPSPLKMLIFSLLWLVLTIFTIWYVLQDNSLPMMG